MVTLNPAVSPSQGDVVLHCHHVIELVTKLAMMASKTNYVNISPGRWDPIGLLFWGSRRSHCQSNSMFFITSCMACSIRFAVARGKEGIIDFVRGSELKVAKGKRGHLLVVSQQLLWCHVGSLQGIRGVLKVKTFQPDDCVQSDFAPQTAPQINTTWRNRVQASLGRTRQTVILLAKWRIATQKLLFVSLQQTGWYHKHTQRPQDPLLIHRHHNYYKNVFNVAINTDKRYFF